MFCKNCGAEIKPTAKFCSNCGQKIKISKLYGLVSFFERHKKFIIWLLVLILASFFIITLINTNNGKDTQVVDSLENTQSYFDTSSTNNNPSMSVVNVLCDNDEGGSGTIITEDGTILTNNHVISGSSFCLVTLADKTSGQVTEAYWSEPITFLDISDEYDIAFLSITEAYTDEDGIAYGDYPRTFPSFFSSSICDNYSPSLGESITIYGYPVTSGGYNLTVTDGIISSFADDGTILTSAKIDSGNSGGLAVNKNGCFVGIPSAVVDGNYQNLGVIIPQTLIDEFYNKIPE